MRLAFLLAIFLLPSLAFATSIELNAKYISIDDDGAVVGSTYTKLFNVETIDKDDCSSGNILDSATIQYEIKDALGSVVKSGSFTKDSIKCRSYSDTGSWTPQNSGTHGVCGKITNSTISNYSSGYFCYNVSVSGVSNNTGNTNSTTTAQNASAPTVTPSSAPRQDCDMEADVEARATIDLKQDKDNYEILLNEPDCSPIQTRISVWVKDITGFIVKTESFEDTVTCSKSYSRRLQDIADGTYFLKVFAEPSSCNDPDIRNNIHEIAVVARNSVGEIKDTIQLKSPEEGFSTSFDSSIEISIESYSEMPGNVDIVLKSADSTIVEHSLQKPPGAFSSFLLLPLPDNCDNIFEEGSYNLNAVLETDVTTSDVVKMFLTPSDCAIAAAETETASGETAGSAPITGAATTKEGGGIVDIIIGFFAGFLGIFG